LRAGRTRSDQQLGVASREQIAGKTGLEIMQSLLRGELPVLPISDTLDFTHVARVVELQIRSGQIDALDIRLY
jgi:hypothetical protein